MDPGEDRGSHEQEHPEQKEIAVDEDVSGKTGKSKEPQPPSPRMESKPSPDDILGTYSVRLKEDVRTQIGLFNCILDYQKLHGRSPFDDEDSINKFFTRWLEVYEPLESIVCVIGDLIRVHNSRGIDDVDNDLERRAFLLVERIWNSGGEKSLGGDDESVVSPNRKQKKIMDESSLSDEEAADGGEDEADITFGFELLKDKDKDEEGTNFTLELLQRAAVYVKETGDDPLESEFYMRKFVRDNVPLDIFLEESKMILFDMKERYEQFKSAEKLGNQCIMPRKERKLMELADNIWGDHNRDVRKNTGISPDHSMDSSLLSKIQTAILIYTEATLNNPFEDETAMDDILSSLSTELTRKERDGMNDFLSSLRVAYEGAKEAKLLTPDGIDAFQNTILGLASYARGDETETPTNDSIQYAGDATVVHDAKPMLEVRDEQVEQQPQMGLVSIDNQCEEEDPEEEV